MIIRKMTEKDYEACVSILNEAVLDGNITFRYECLKADEWASDLLDVCRFVACEGERILGWIAFHRYSARPAYKGVAEVSIYLTKDARGKGIGTALYETVIPEAKRCGFWTLCANIFAKNESSCHLHEKVGFRKIGERDRIAKTLHGEWMNVAVYELRF